MSEFRQCSLCGRDGLRAFLPMGAVGGWVCKYERACNRRRRAWLNSFKRPRRKAAA